MSAESSAPPRRLPGSIRSVALFVVLAAITAGAFLTWQRGGGGAEGPRGGSEIQSQASVATGREPSPSPTRAVTPTPEPTAIRRPGVSSLSGSALARAWLRAFLTRNDRNDDRWVAPVAALSENDVIDALRAAGPDAVGLQQLTSWRVERIDQVDYADSAVDTPTRQVLAYAATVTDGVRTEQKPFVLYAYLDPDGSWRVGDVEQPYSSEG